MSRHFGWLFTMLVMLAVSAPLHALNYEVGGCKTGASWVNFTTISAAVVAVPAGATILVCPGVYPEQVPITQPLTLQGIRSGNSNRAVITINPNGNLVEEKAHPKMEAPAPPQRSRLSSPPSPRTPVLPVEPARLVGSIK